MRGSMCLLACAVATVLVTAACSSDTTGTQNTPGDDSGADGGNGSDGGGSSCVGSSTVMMMLQRDGATSSACVTCMETSCGCEINACNADSVCGPSLACLIATDISYTPGGPTGMGCDGALSAISSGNVPLKNWNACAVQKCCRQCDAFSSNCSDGG